MTTVYLDPRANKETPEEEIESPKPFGYYLGVFLALFVALPVTFMLLWNWLMPVIFGLPSIGFFKSIGLLVMSFILFKK